MLFRSALRVDTNTVPDGLNANERASAILEAKTEMEKPAGSLINSNGSLLPAKPVFGNWQTQTNNTLRIAWGKCLRRINVTILYLLYAKSYRIAVTNSLTTSSLTQAKISYTA